MLVSIPTKTYMMSTMMILVFDQIHPCEQKKEEEMQK